MGCLPTFDAATGNYVFFIRADGSLSYIVLTNGNLATGTWGTNTGPIAITANAEWVVESK
jgi:hypothetical protein